jgi:NDP-sugar pyrophosphorylase family protein
MEENGNYCVVAPDVCEIFNSANHDDDTLIVRNARVSVNIIGSSVNVRESYAVNRCFLQAVVYHLYSKSQNKLSCGQVREAIRHNISDKAVTILRDKTHRKLTLINCRNYLI